MLRAMREFLPGAKAGASPKFMSFARRLGSGQDKQTSRQTRSAPDSHRDNGEREDWHEGKDKWHREQNKWQSGHNAWQSGQNKWQDDAKWHGDDSLCSEGKIYVTHLPVDISEDDLRTVFETY